jgi:hypothetical protein
MEVGGRKDPAIPSDEREALLYNSVMFTPAMD